jgi:hypothetical protein
MKRTAIAIVCGLIVVGLVGVETSPAGSLSKGRYAAPVPQPSVLISGIDSSLVPFAQMLVQSYDFHKALLAHKLVAASAKAQAAIKERDVSFSVQGIALGEVEMLQLIVRGGGKNVPVKDIMTAAGDVLVRQIEVFRSVYIPEQLRLLTEQQTVRQRRLEALRSGLAAAAARVPGKQEEQPPRAPQFCDAHKDAACRPPIPTPQEKLARLKQAHTEGKLQLARLNSAVKDGRPMDVPEVAEAVRSDPVVAAMQARLNELEIVDAVDPDAGDAKARAKHIEQLTAKLRARKAELAAEKARLMIQRVTWHIEAAASQLEAIETGADRLGVRRRDARLAELDAAALAPQVTAAAKALAATTNQMGAAKAALAREIKVVHIFRLITAGSR